MGPAGFQNKTSHLLTCTSIKLSPRTGFYIGDVHTLQWKVVGTSVNNTIPNKGWVTT